jgi:hypothetical protein
MKRYFKYLCLLSFSVSTVSCAETLNPTSNEYSGIYEQVSIAVTPDSRIVGVFKEERGDRLSCIIGFTGTLVNGKAKITTVEERHDGDLSFKDNIISLTIPNAQEHPGCGMAIGPEIATGIKFGPKEPANWIDLKIVPQDGLILYSSPLKNSETVATLNNWKIVGVLENKDTWTKVSYFYIEETQDGWIEGFKEGWVESSALKSIK